jgi:hypothetical protein
MFEPALNYSLVGRDHARWCRRFGVTRASRWLVDKNVHPPYFQESSGLRTLRPGWLMMWVLFWVVVAWV